MTLSLTDIFRSRSRKEARDPEASPNAYSRASSRGRATPAPTETSTRPPSSCSVVPPRVHPGRIGLHIAYPAEHSPYVDAQADADIVAVHGLGGSVDTTWGDSRSCLEDVLPGALPSSRFLAYGYDSVLAFSKPPAGPDHFAADLLLRLKAIRSRTLAETRPLIFIAHGLGGIIIKKALILAEEDPQKYGHVAKYAKGLVFIGTPHHDLAEEPLGDILVNLISQTRLRRGMRKSIVRQLDQNIELIVDTSRRFLPLASHLGIVSFYQEHAETHPIVPRSSAVLGITDEKIHARHANHHDMCHFNSRDTTELDFLVDAITPWIKHEGEGHGAGLLGIDFLPARHSSLRRRGSRLMNRLSKKLSESTLRISSESHGRFLHLSREEQPSRPPSAAVSTRSARSSHLTVTFHGLHRMGVDRESGETFSEVLHLPKNTLVKDLGSILRTKYPDIDLSYGCSETISSEQFNPEWARFEVFGHEVKATWLDVFTTPVMVTDESSCYDISHGLKINHHQTISSYLSKLYPSPLEARIDAIHIEGERQPFTTGTPSSAIVVGQNDTADLRIHLNREMNKMEGRNVAVLPFDFQRFPIFDVQPFRERFPPCVTARGGAFIPINAAIETARLGFQCNKSKRFLLRFLVEGEGAAAGELALSDDGLEVISWNKKLTFDKGVSIPDSAWVEDEQTTSETAASLYTDGKDSGFSGSPQDSEEDIVSQHKVDQQLSRVHLQIIPKLDTRYHYAGTTREVAILKQSEHVDSRQKTEEIYTTYFSNLPSGTRQLANLKTPAEQGISFGDVLHVKDLRKKLPPRLKTIQDLFEECPIPAQPRDHLELTFSKMEPAYRIFADSLRGLAIPIDVIGQTTIFQIKLLLHQRTGTMIENIQLKFGGVLLRDEACVCDYKISENAHIQFVQSEVLEPVCATFMYQGKMYTTDDRCFSFASLKSYIQEHFGLPAEMIHVSNSYKEFKDSDTVSSEDIYQISVIPDIGSGLTKIPCRKNNHAHDSRTWDVTNSKIVTLNFLDPSTFTEVTGLKVPEMARTGGKNLDGIAPSCGYDAWLQKVAESPRIWNHPETEDSESDYEFFSDDLEESKPSPANSEPLLGPSLFVANIDDSIPPLNRGEGQGS